MAIPVRDKIYVPQTVSELRDQWLDDWEGGMRDAGVTGADRRPGTEVYIRGTANAELAFACHHNTQIHAEDSSELTAQGEALDRIRRAMGLPEVGAAPASGRVTVAITGAGTATFQDGTQFTLPTGLRGAVSGTQTGIFNGGAVDVLMIDAGSASNAKPGTTIKWVSPPVNVETEGTVDVDGLTGGVDQESDERKRNRILNRRANLPAGGNWSHLVELAESATGSVQKCFVYPALGGPGSAKVVVVKALDPDNEDFSRALGAASITIAADAIFSEVPSPMEIVVESVTDENIDVALKLSLPDASSAQGSSVGWLDSSPFPSLVSADNGFVTVSSVTDTKNITIDANTTTAPVAGQTRIAWWCPTVRQFVTATVVSSSGSAGAWTLTLDKPLSIGSDSVTAGDFISPVAANIASYGSVFLAQTNTLGPGENTSDANRLPRAKRHPFVTSGSYPSDLTVLQIKALVEAHSEIADAQYGYTSKGLSSITPTVPATVADSPNVLRLRHFGVYPL